MNLKVDFKSSGGSMKADFGTVTELALDQREAYEKIIADLEKEKALAYESGFSEGKKLEYDTFWDSFQNNGELTNYTRVFSGRGWDDVNFKPKYDMVPTSTSYMFNFAQVSDLEAILKKCNVKLDTSKATSTAQMFYYSTVTVVPPLNICSSQDLTSMFAYASNLHTIRKLIISDDGSQEFKANTFNQCKALKNLTIEGIIKSDIDLSHSPLSHDSIYNLIFNLSTEIEPESRTIIFSKSAVNKAFETEPDANNGYESEAWSDICHFRPMWNMICQ